MEADEARQMRERRGGVESLTGWREQKRHNQREEAMIENEEGRDGGRIERRGGW